MKKVWDWFYGNLIVLSVFTALWFLLVLVNTMVSPGNGSGFHLLDGLMGAQISDTMSNVDLAVYFILIGFAIVSVIRAFQSTILWSLLFLANAAAAIIWYVSAQPNSGDWSAFAPYITVFLTVLMAIDVAFNLLRSKRPRATA